MTCQSIPTPTLNVDFTAPAPDEFAPDAASDMD